MILVFWQKADDGMKRSDPVPDADHVNFQSNWKGTKVLEDSAHASLVWMVVQQAFHDSTPDFPGIVRARDDTL